MNDFQIGTFRLYYGWVLVALAVLLYAVVLGTTSNAFSLFVLPVSEEYQLTRATMNTAYALFTVGSAAFAPVIGWLLDRYPARPIILTSALLLGGGLSILGLSHSTWLSLAVLAVVLPAGADGAAVLSMSVLVARWFPVNRSRALAISAVGLSLGGVLIPPLSAASIQTLGWRTTLVFTGAAVTLVFVVSIWLLRERPDSSALATKPAAASSAGTPQHESLAAPEPVRVQLRKPALWLIGVSIALIMGVNTTISISLVPIAVAQGVPVLRATMLIAALSIMAVVSKLLLAAFGNRVDKIRLATTLFLLAVPVNLGLILASDFGALLACAASVGLIAGTTPALLQIILVDTFGVASYGTVRGLTTPIIATCTALCARFAGQVYDQTRDYDYTFAVFIVLQIAAAVMMRSAGQFSRRRLTQPAL